MSTHTHTHTYYSPDNSQHLTVESCVLEALSWSSPAVFSWKRLKSGKIDRFSQSKPKPSEAITNELQSSFQCDKDMPGKGLALSIQTASIRTIQTHTHTHTNQKCLGDIPPWPNQKPTSVPAKGCDLVWAYLEELIQLHETPTNGIEHNELGWWVKKSISGVQHLFPPSFWKNIQQTAAWNHHPNELGMIKFQWFFGRNIDVCVCECVCVCVSVRWPYNPNKQLSQHESIWCPEKHTHTNTLTWTHISSTQRPSVHLVDLGLHMVPVEVMAQWLYAQEWWFGWLVVLKYCYQNKLA